MVGMRGKILHSPQALFDPRNMRALVVLEEALGCNPCSNIMRRSGSDGCQKCSRITLGFLNVGKASRAPAQNFLISPAAFFIVGCLFIAAGSIVKSNYQGTIFSLNTTLINPRDAQDLRDFAHLAPISLIVLGSVVTLVSLIGCIGSSFEKRYLLIMFAPTNPNPISTDFFSIIIPSILSATWPHCFSLHVSPHPSHITRHTSPITLYTSRIPSATAPSLPSSSPPKSPSVATQLPSKRTSGNSVLTLSTAALRSPAAVLCLTLFAASG